MPHRAEARGQAIHDAIAGAYANVELEQEVDGLRAETELQERVTPAIPSEVLGWVGVDGDEAS